MADEQNTTDQTQQTAFDPTAFKAEMLMEFNKTLNGFAKTFKTDIGKMMQQPKEAAAEQQTQQQETPQTQGDGKQKDPHIAGLELQLKQSQQAFQTKLDAEIAKREAADKKAEETERASMIRAKLGKMNIREDAFDDAFSVIAGQVKRSEDGSLIAGDLPLDQYIETQLKGPKAYMLKPVDVNGSDAARGQRINGKAVTMETIRPGMSNEETQAAMNQIATLV